MVNKTLKIVNDYQGRPYDCQPGQMVTSLASIKKLCGKGVTIQNIRTSLHRFERFGFLTYQSTKSNRLITICHWETWQCEETQANKATNKRVTNESQTANKHLTTNKKDKNEKKDKKREGTKRERFAPPTLEEIQSFIQQENYEVDGAQFYHYYQANGWQVGRVPMRSWQAAVAKWHHSSRRPKKKTAMEILEEDDCEQEANDCHAGLDPASRTTPYDLHAQT